MVCLSTASPYAFSSVLPSSVATALAKAGTPAYVTSKVLGHSSVHFTANTYHHADDKTIDRALAGLEEAFGRGG
jgi:integrase